MTIISVKTNFTSGQISNDLFGRGDLNAYENGARCLENVIIYPTGGISRRQGLKMVDMLEGAGKLIPFEFNSEQEYVLCLLDYKMKIYKKEKCIAVIETPWGLEHHAKLNWTQSADTLLIVHPNIEPQQITRNNEEVWKIQPWEYYEKEKMICCPYFNFYNKKIKLSITTNNEFIILTSNSEIFSPEYIGVKIKLNGGLVEVVEYNNTFRVVAKVIKPLTKTTATDDWEEQSFSKLRGWPCSVTFHQDRLVIGGARSLPNRLWLSQSSDLFNFDLGTGLDDEAIEFAILADQVNVICNVVSSKHLLVFTTGSEWMVSGEVLTPTKIQLSRQTNIGCYCKYSIAPEQVNGATVFLSYSGKQLREFLYTDTEQAYLNKDLTLLAGKVIDKPVCSSFNKDDNVLYILMESGLVSCLTSYRTEEVNAWSQLKTQGKFLSLTIVGEDIYFIVFRNGKYFLEKFEQNFFVDCGLELSSIEPRKLWTGLDIMEGNEVSVISKGFYLGKYVVKEGAIDLYEDVCEITVGFPYEHKVEPLPYMVDSVRPFSPQGVRAVSSVFRLLNTKSFCVDVGNGYLDVPLKRLFKNKILDAPPIVYSGDVDLRSVKWIRDLEKAVWSIKSDVPLPFCLLSVVMKLKIKN